MTMAWAATTAPPVGGDERHDMSVADPQSAVPEPSIRWYRLTPGRFVLVLLAIEGLLWLSERFGCLAWHKGYAVLTAVVSVGVMMLLMLLWFAAALLFRWRFQLGVRSLLVLVVAVAIPFSWLATEVQRAKRQYEHEERLIAVIQGYGGEVNRSSEPCWWRGENLGKYFERPVRLKFCTSSHCADCFYTSFAHWPKEELPLLAEFPQLRHVELSGSGFDDAVIRYLSQLREVERLDLNSTAFTDAGLAALETIPRLKLLNLSNTSVGIRGIGALRQQPNLEEIDLSWCPRVNDEAVAMLATFPRLKRVSLLNTATSDKAKKILTEAGIETNCPSTFFRERLTGHRSGEDEPPTDLSCF